MRAHIHITLYRTTFQSYTKTWSTSIDKCFKPLKNKQIILPKQDARGLFRNSTTPSPSQRLWNDLPKKAFGGGPCPCPKRWGGDKPIVRYDLFLTKALKLGMGEVKNCPQTRTQNPTARMYLAIPKPCDGEATLNQNRSCNATENQRIISFPWQQKISQNCSRFVWVLAIHKEIMKVFSFLIYLIWPQLALSISATSWLESPEIEGLHCVSIHFRDENSSGFKSSCVQNRDEILTWSGGLCKANASSNTKSWHITW